MTLSDPIGERPRPDGDLVTTLRLRTTARRATLRILLDVLTTKNLDPDRLDADGEEICVRFAALAPAAGELLRHEIAQIPGVEEVRLDRASAAAPERLIDLEIVPFAAVAVDPHGRIVGANERLEKLLQKPGPLRDSYARTGIIGVGLGRLLGSDALAQAIVKSRFTHPLQEIEIATVSLFIECHKLKAGETGLILFMPAEDIGRILTFFETNDPLLVDPFFGRSKAIRTLLDQVERVARSDAPLLVIAKNGTGKQSIARLCHRKGPRADRAFLNLDCAQRSDMRLAIEIFGQSSGMAVGRTRSSRPGLFELARGGTLLMENITELPLSMQERLAETLRTGRCRRLGSRTDRACDVRVIATASDDLELLVANGRFLRSLQFELSRLIIRLPSIDQRREDLPALAQAYLEAAAELTRVPGTHRPVPRLTADALEFLGVTPWPGNLKELEDVLLKAGSDTAGPILTAEEIEAARASRPGSAGPSKLETIDPEAVESLPEAVKSFEAAVLKRLYPQFHSSRRLAERLGVSHTTIAQKLKAYGIVG